MLADACPAAILAPAPDALVLADASPAAILALAPFALVLAEGRPTTILAVFLLPLVRAQLPLLASSLHRLVGQQRRSTPFYAALITFCTSS